MFIPQKSLDHTATTVIFFMCKFQVSIETESDIHPLNTTDVKCE